MYKYLFGPVPSRRLGTSLGVDLVPSKVCSLNCVYCEVGKTTRLTTQRKAYIPAQKVICELEHYFEKNPDPDYITLSGAGEPTLNSGMKEVIDFCRSIRPSVPVAVLTNGTLLSSESVRDALSNAQLVMPSLDAVSQDVFDKINRPHESVDVKKMIDGLTLFSNTFHGEIWLEIFLLPGYNMHPEELEKFKKALGLIRAEKIQINTLDRPGTELGLVPASLDQLMEIKHYFELDNIEIIASSASRSEQKSYRDDIECAILETILRRPCTAQDLVAILGIHINELNKYLSKLNDQGKIEQFNQARGTFYRKK